jgi:hypothetical protein
MLQNDGSAMGDKKHLDLLFYVQAFSMIMSMTGRFLGIITTTTETDQLFVEEAMEEPPTHSS